MMQFTPTRDFWSDELQSQYSVGLSYTVGPEDKRLASLVQKWLSDGKVVAGTPTDAAISALFSGKGSVK
jgi:hypothetical protein